MKTNQSPLATSPNALFEQIARAEGLMDLTSIQLFDVPAVKDDATRLALRQALAVRRELIRANALIHSTTPRLADGRCFKAVFA